MKTMSKLMLILLLFMSAKVYSQRVVKGILMLNKEKVVVDVVCADAIQNNEYYLVGTITIDGAFGNPFYHTNNSIFVSTTNNAELLYSKFSDRDTFTLVFDRPIDNFVIKSYIRGYKVKLFVNSLR